MGNRKLTLEDLINVTRNGCEVKISEEAKEKIAIARKLVDDYVEEGRVSYGITTGFGKFSDQVISKEETATLQRNLIISHACGVGNPLPIDAVRGIMLLRVNNLIQGHSGIRQEVIDLLVNMINKGVTPYIPEKGSLGASG
ncbi:MAG: aromatic amino acid lyase, partial [Cetobacterium sp.]